jgi:hypothetical protein
MFKELWFLCKVAWIFISELIKYKFVRDYPKFIDQLSCKLARINILYVKVFQAVALNIDDTINNNLLKYTDNAPWSADDIDKELLFKIASENDLYIVNENPINSGMISLVFKLFRKDTNEPVILKMKRLNIDSILSEASVNLVFFVKLLNIIPIVKDLHISDIIINNMGIIQNQTNFEQEVQNMIDFKEKCKGLKYMKVPKVFPEVTRAYRDCIMMEFIDGVTIHKVLEDDYEMFAKYHIKAVIACGLMFGLVHGDLHAGNILFIKDENDKKYKYKIGVIDYGIIFRFNEIQRNKFLEFVNEILSISSDITTERIINMGVIEPIEVFNSLPKHQYDEIFGILSGIIHDTLFVSKRADCKKIFTAVKILNDYLKKHDLKKLGLRPSEGFVVFQVVIAMLYGVIITLCKNDTKLLVIFDESVTELFHFIHFS